MPTRTIATGIDLYTLPVLPADQKRRIYVSGLDAKLREHLLISGYEPIELMSLPRTTDDDNLAYIRAKLQAIEEGTVPASEEDRKRLELQARSYGLLDANRRSVSVTVSKSEDLDKLLTWDSGRHTLAQNSTAIWAQPPGKKDDE